MAVIVLDRFIDVKNVVLLDVTIVVALINVLTMANVRGAEAVKAKSQSIKYFLKPHNPVAFKST